MSCISFTSTIAQVPQSSFLNRVTGRLTVKKSLVPFGSQRVIVRGARLAMRCNDLEVKCGTAQTETISRKSSSSVASPLISKEPLPLLDDGGSGFNGSEVPPFYRGDEGGGGGYGGGGRGGGGFSFGGFSWGGFWFLLFLRFLHYYMSKDKEREERYKILTGRRKTISHYLG